MMMALKSDLEIAYKLDAGLELDRFISKINQDRTIFTYSQRADTALTLLPEEPLMLTIHRYVGKPKERGEYEAVLMFGVRTRHQGRADTIALAICRAWLIWKARGSPK